jgi:acetyl-CoA acyltransferase
MTASVICGYARSAFTPAKKGALAATRPDDIAAGVLKSLLQQTGARGEAIADVICGNAFPEGEQGLNLGRMLVFLAGLPHNVAGQTVNRWCGSSMEAIHIAAGYVAAGKGELFACVGVESMTRIPMGGYNPLPNPALYNDLPDAYVSMGLTAENVAKRYSISRAQQEAFAVASHHKAAAANFSDEIVSVAGVSTDGCIRPTTTPEELATLNPAFDVYGTITAGTSSPLTDGAAAVLVASEAYADAHGLPKLARIKAMATTGLEPGVMGLGPIGASQLAMQRAGITAQDLAVIELNEAFAAQAIPCIRELGLDEARVNIHGGAIALGHPLGASGARIAGKAALLLSQGAVGGGDYALATACIGGGMGIATVLERI